MTNTIGKVTCRTDNTAYEFSGSEGVVNTIKLLLTLLDSRLYHLHLSAAVGYYTRIAISGDRRDAFQAGKSPASKVTDNLAIVHFR